MIKKVKKFYTFSPVKRINNKGGTMDRKLKALFDYQKFNENKKIILHCLFKAF